MIEKVKKIEIEFDERISDEERKNIAMAIAMILHTNIYFNLKDGNRVGVKYDMYAELKQRIGTLLNKLLNQNKRR